MSALEGYLRSLKTLIKDEEKIKNGEGVEERKGIQAYFWVRIHHSCLSGFAMPLQRLQSTFFSRYMSLVCLSERHRIETLERYS